MDQLIEMAKEMGEAIQMDERFIRTQMAQAAADDDEALQGMIGEFNLKRLAVNNEYGKDEKDEQKQEGYVPRPKSEVWLARVGLVLFIAFVIYQIISIARGGL